MKCPPPARDPRYDRQIPLIGEEGQEKLSKATVAIVGLGGLGSITSQYLAAAGVGELIIIDADTVEENNLNRQLLYDAASIGLPKAPLAARRLKSLNPCIRVEWRQARISDDNIGELIPSADLILDCLDNWETRLVLDRYSRRTGIPLLHAAVEGYYGQVYLSVPGRTACLECIAPSNLNVKRKIPVLGASVGIVASLQALIAIRYLVGDYRDEGTLILVDGRRPGIDKIDIDPGACKCTRV